jgi:hypothetical protein
LLALNGTAEEAAGKSVPGQKVRSQRPKPNSKQYSYRSGEPLRDAKSNTESSFFAGCEAVLFPKRFIRWF